MDSSGDFGSGANETSGRPRRSTASFAKNKRVVASVEGRWTEEEHKRFIEGLKLYGKQWMKISHDFVPTRTPIQVRSHAQKFLLQCERQGVDGDSNVDMEDLGEGGEGAVADGSVGEGETLAALQIKAEAATHSSAAANPDGTAVPSPLPVLSRDGSGMSDIAGACNASYASGRTLPTATGGGGQAASASAGPASSKDGDETSVGFAPDSAAPAAAASPALAGEAGAPVPSEGGAAATAPTGEPDKRRSRRPGPSILVTRPVSLAASARQELVHMKDVLHHARQQAEARAEAAATAAAVSLIEGTMAASGPGAGAGGGSTAAAGTGTEPGLAEQPPATQKLSGSRRGSNQAAELPQSPRKRSRAGRPSRPAKEDGPVPGPRAVSRRRAGGGASVSEQEQEEFSDAEDDAVYIENELAEDDLVLAGEEGMGAVGGGVPYMMGPGMAGGYYMGAPGMAMGMGMGMGGGYMPMPGMTPFYRDASQGGGAQAMPMPMMMMPMGPVPMEGVTHTALGKGKSPVAASMPMGAMPMMYGGPAGMPGPYVMMMPMHPGGMTGQVDAQSMMAMGAMNMNAMMMAQQGQGGASGAPVVYTRAGGAGRAGVVPVAVPSQGWRGGDSSGDVGMDGSPASSLPMQGMPFSYAHAIAMGIPMGAYTTSMGGPAMGMGMPAMAAMGAGTGTGTAGKGSRSASAASATSGTDANMQVDSAGAGEDLDALLVALESKGGAGRAGAGKGRRPPPSGVKIHGQEESETA